MHKKLLQPSIVVANLFSETENARSVLEIDVNE